MIKKDRFVCWLPCKPYVRQFLLHNFNDPDDSWGEIVNLKTDKELQADFLSRLSKTGRYEKRYSNLSRYTTVVPIEIQRDDFYRYGWSMSNTEVVAFGTKIERRIKQILFLYLDTHVSMGLPLSAAIRNFQAKFGFTEDTWSYDTIRREYNRHGYKKTGEKSTIFDFINHIILGKLSEFGTISQQGKLAYESGKL
ncbi:hypothetical protein [uncultured Bacteroides sp.]|uniref:hypothetical protein n=1 Tax=uncultured Bacteroides sp. TaxID=162156 RepID=UPI00261C415B|nr:hypothetical protein [uncultured Bacteroides sp.]